MKYIFMIQDECGDCFRAYGNDFLEKDHTFPDFEEDDEAMQAAFEAWRIELERKGQEIWEKICGPECRIFLEEDYSYKYQTGFRFCGAYF